MKKYVALVLAMLMALCLCAACGNSGTAVVDNDPGMDAVSAAVQTTADNENMTDIPESYLETMLKLTADDYTQCYTRISSVGTNIDEFGVFKTDDPASMKKALEKYLEYREMIWMDEYLPQEHPKLQNAQVWAEGNYVMYAILDTNTLNSTETAFKGCFEG